jgi:hypothetical protein
MQPERTWRTREDPFDEVWDQLQDKLEINPGLEAKTLFEWLQRLYPGRYSDGQLRTLQRRIKHWRGLSGPAKEIFFDQIHKPGELCESDFTHMSELGVTINGLPFKHLVYHFVLTYSNWETGTVCFSESFESLSFGLQNALWKLGGVPRTHRTKSQESVCPYMPLSDVRRHIAKAVLSEDFPRICPSQGNSAINYVVHAAKAMLRMAA